MPREGDTMKEQRQNLIRDCLLYYYSVTELSERLSVSRKTAHKWINRFHPCHPPCLAAQAIRYVASRVSV